MVQLSATRCSCITILRVSLVSLATITLCVASQQVFIVVVYFVIDSVWKLMDTPSYFRGMQENKIHNKTDENTQEYPILVTKICGAILCIQVHIQ
jgi:hypothetical protein